MAGVISGFDTVVLNGRVFNDIADGDCVTLTFPNDISSVKVGKDGNAIYGFNEMGRIIEGVLRIPLASSDDKWLNSRFQEWINKDPSFIFISGSFTKRVIDGKGNVSYSIYQLDGGVPKKLVDTKDNAEADTEQSVAIYNIVFTQGNRSIQ